MTETHRIAGPMAGDISAVIKAEGAELCSLQDCSGRELLWQAGAAWPNHSPVLFPIVGQVADDRIEVAGQAYALTRHGFARRRRFEWVARGESSCALLLRSDAATRAVFPFEFALTLTYRIEGETLHVEYALANPGSSDLPASLGAHPAFKWPLGAGSQTDYRLEFADMEDAPIHRLAAGLMDPAGRPTPVQGRVLALDPALFVDDAIIMLTPRSRSLRYLGPEGGLEFAWDGFLQLGLWQKPGGDFLCIEPWHGYSSPVGWQGEFRDKPGVLLVPAGETRTMGWRVRPLDAL